MKRVSLLGKGPLAIKAAEWFLKSPKYKLVNIVPVTPYPHWCENIIYWAEVTKTKVVYDHNELPDSDLDLVVSIFYEKIIKKDFIDRCRKIINLHNAPLPKYRGVRPINWALKNNEPHHGVTIHEITPGIDDGPILGKIEYPIYPEIESVKDVYEKSVNYGYLLFTDVLSKIDNIKAVEQDHSQATYYSNKTIEQRGDRSGW